MDQTGLNVNVTFPGMEHSPGPVGTAHKKINPMAELPDMNTREKFWQQDQEQEKVIVVMFVM